jgi:hypothetical protein
MAICDWCGKDKCDRTLGTCSGNSTVTFPDGVTLPAMPFVPLRRMLPEEWWATWRKCREEMGDDSRALDSEGEAAKRHEHYQANWDRCRSCLVLAGGHHHPGCGSEKCPRCGYQLISCGCLGGDDEEDE